MNATALADFNQKLTAISVDQRQRLLQQVNEMFDSGEVAPRFVEVIGKVMCAILKGIPIDRRRGFAQKIAENPEAPHPVVVHLANDEIAVAESILMWSKALTAEDMVDVVRRHATPHLEVLARRPGVSPPVTNELIARGGRSVVQELAGNYAALFSDENEIRLKERARDDGVLQYCLERRKVYLSVARERAERKAHGSGYGAAFDFTRARATLAADGVLAPTGETIVAYARKTDASAALHALALAIGSNAESLARLLADRRIEPVVMALRSLDMIWPEASRALTVVCGDRLPPGEVERLAAMFRTATTASAKNVVRFLQVKPGRH